MHQEIPAAEYRATRARGAPARCHVPPNEDSILGALAPDQHHGTLLESSPSPAPPSRERALLHQPLTSGILQRCSSAVSLPTPSRYVSRTSCKSSVRSAILGSASMT